MIKKNKRIMLLILLILSSINNVTIVNAAKAGGKAPGPSSNNVNNGNTGTPREAGSLSCGADGWTATCSASTTSGGDSYIIVDMWDMYGNYIAETFDFEKNIKDLGLDKILAGTYVGINIYEEKTYWQRVDITSSGIQEYHKCYKSWSCPYTCTINGVQTTCPKTCNHTIPKQQGTKCPSGYRSIETFFEWVSSCDSAYRECKNSNKPTRSWGATPSFVAKYRDSNDIISPIFSNHGKLESITPNDKDGNWYWYIEDKIKFSYNMSNGCINVKTGKVSYKEEECEGIENYSVTSLNGHWKYFIPLNASSKQKFNISLEEIGNTGLIKGEICRDIIKNHPNEYTTLIKPKEGMLENDIERDKTIVSNGCYWSTNINIPIVQRFYNEQENGINFKGFNFYYKPIDINNPFPNGVSETSLWNEWNKDGNNFTNNTTTYIAYTNGSESKIRNYNKTISYTSWDNMNIDGTSQFVRKEGIFDEENLPKASSIYNLGCGPWNENEYNEDGSKNYFYQPECDTE